MAKDRELWCYQIYACIQQHRHPKLLLRVAYPSWLLPGTPAPVPRPAISWPRCAMWRPRAGSRRMSGCRSPMWFLTSPGGCSSTCSRRGAPATLPDVPQQLWHQQARAKVEPIH